MLLSNLVTHTINDCFFLKLIDDDSKSDPLNNYYMLYLHVIFCVAVEILVNAGTTLLSEFLELSLAFHCNDAPGLIEPT